MSPSQLCSLRENSPGPCQCCRQQQWPWPEKQGLLSFVNGKIPQTFRSRKQFMNIVMNLLLPRNDVFKGNLWKPSITQHCHWWWRGGDDNDYGPLRLGWWDKPLRNVIVVDITSLISMEHWNPLWNVRVIFQRIIESHLKLSFTIHVKWRLITLLFTYTL